MDANKIQCLVDKGILSQDQADYILSLSQGPQGTSALLTIIAASLLGSSNNSIYGDPIGTQSIADVDSTTSTALTPTTGASRAVVTPFNNSALFRLDGGAPNASTNTGHFLAQGSNMVVTDLVNFRFCSASSGSDVTLYVTYY